MAAGLAVDAFLRHAFGTAAVFNGRALFHQSNALFAALADQLQRGENAGRTGADDHDVLFHNGCGSFRSISIKELPLRDYGLSRRGHNSQLRAVGRNCCSIAQMDFIKPYIVYRKKGESQDAFCKSRKRLDFLFLMPPLHGRRFFPGRCRNLCGNPSQCRQR